jgi:hypothetical protein
MTTIEILNRGSLLTYHDGGYEQCLGYLIHFPEHGTYDANLGRVDVSPDEADTHNHLLDEAMIEGLDDNCQVGQHGSFYLGKKDGRTVVQTFVGTVVSNDVSQRGSSITFRRKGRAFRGRARKHCNLFNFRRVG